jgi:hypothetical protein
MKTWILGLIALGYGSGAALADPVTYDFTVTATSGPLTGSVAEGSFTFDSTIAPPGGGGLMETGLISALSFSWDGVTYSASSANSGDLVFNASGGLLFAQFGNDCASVPCSAASFPGSKDWLVAGPVSALPAAIFAYAVGNEGVFNGTVSFSLAPPPTAAPEPATLPMLALALLGVAVWRHKRQRPRARIACSADGAGAS